jgi:SAM-dependent methyltransferase
LIGARRGAGPARAAAPACPLCAAAHSEPHAAVADRSYFRCPGCQLIFLDPQRWPSAEQEAAHYRLHRNAIHDPGYRRFVSPLVEALRTRLAPASQGLDFGCGPGPVVSAMLEEAGHRLRGYDPQFLPDRAALRLRYDFIVLSEVAEHLHTPIDVFTRLRALLRPGGLIAVMTGFAPDPPHFARWHYLRDPTHVMFYAPPTLRWLAGRLGLGCAIPGPNIALLDAPG